MVALMHKYFVISDYILWALMLLANLLILTVLFFRRNFRILPVFTTFISFSIAKTVVLMLISRFAGPRVYYDAWYYGSVLRTLLLLAVAYELFECTFAPLHKLRNGMVQRVMWSFTLLTTIALALAVCLPVSFHHPLTTFRETFDRTATFIVCAIMFAVGGLATSMGIPMRRKVFGIALGCLFFLSVDAVSNSAVWMYTVNTAQFNRAISMGAGVISQIVWLTYLWPANPAVIPPTDNQIAEMWQMIGKKRDIEELACSNIG